jgi:hypothetical protein
VTRVSRKGIVSKRKDLPYRPERSPHRIKRCSRGEEGSRRGLGPMQRLSRLLPSLRVSHIVAGLACVICFVAGYLLAGSWSDANDTTPLEQICARVDHVNSLQEEFPEQQAASEA